MANSKHLKITQWKSMIFRNQISSKTHRLIGKNFSSLRAEMSRVSHLRSLFEEKVRQANDEKERSKATSPRHHRSPNKWRDSLNRSEDTSGDKTNVNTSSDSTPISTPTQSQESFNINDRRHTINEFQNDHTFHVVQEPRDYIPITSDRRTISGSDLAPEFVKTKSHEDSAPQIVDVEPSQVDEKSPEEIVTLDQPDFGAQSVAADHQGPMHIHITEENHEKYENNGSDQHGQEEQHDGQPRSGIWKVQIEPRKSPRELAMIAEESKSSAESSPRSGNSSLGSAARVTTDGVTLPNDEVSPRVIEEHVSNIDGHVHETPTSDTVVKTIGALSIVDDYIAVPNLTPVTPVEDDKPKQLLKQKNEELENMEDLIQDEIEKIKSKLGALELKHITLGTLLIAHQGQWEVTNLNGILILAVDYARKSYVLRLYKRDTYSAVWEHRFHKGFIYQQATPTFHTFETSEHNPLIYGLKLFNEQDAKELHSKVLYFKNTVIKTKEELEAEKQQKSIASLPPVPLQPIQPASNNNNTDDKSKTKSKKKSKRGFFDKIFGGKSDSAPKDFQISSPANFKHASHIGVSEKGEFEITNIPNEWKEIFRQAGIRKQDIKDMETFNFVVNVINDAVETQQAAQIQEERQNINESDEPIASYNPVVVEPQPNPIEIKNAPPLPPRPAFMKEEPIKQEPIVTEVKTDAVVVEDHVQPVAVVQEISTEFQESPNMESSGSVPPPPPPPPVISEHAKSPTLKKSILADLPPPPPARSTLMTEIQQGTKLRKVDKNDPAALPDIKGLNQKQTKSLADTLASAMATRRFEMQEAAPSNASNDDDWD